MSPMCVTCLSKNRRLVLFESLNISWSEFQLNRGARVCWECKALFLRFDTFRQQVSRAQTTLKSHSKKPRHIPSLSALTVSHKDSFDHIYLDEDVVKPESLSLELKEEFIDDLKPDPGAVGTDIPVELVFATPGTSLNVSFEDPLDKSLLGEVRTSTGIEPGIPQSNGEQEKDLENSDSDVQNDSTDWLEPTATKEPRRRYASHLIKNVSEEEMLQARYLEMNTTGYVNAQYKCESCVIKFVLEDKYKKHMAKHKPEAGNFMCQLCRQRFKQESTAKKHFLDHYRFYQCRACAFTHHRLGTVQRHFENEHEAVRVFQCKLCDEEFLTSCRRKHHMQTAAHKAAPQCPHCSKIFSNPCNLKVHLRTHGVRPKLECNVCHKQYTGQKNLRAHMRSHDARAQTEETAYCAECDVRFKNRLMYLSHLKYSSRHLTEESYRYQCNECGRKYIMKHSLEEHIEREHLKILQYACEQCEQKFVSRRQKRHHVHVVHKMAAPPDRRVNCTICGKQFATSTTLRIHHRIHTGERPYACSYCPMRFTQKSTLRTHIKGKHKEAGLLP